MVSSARSRVSGNGKRCVRLAEVPAGDMSAAPVVNLQTNFGGGKTHNLIALYHATRSGIPNGLAPSGCAFDQAWPELVLASAFARGGFGR